MAGPVFRVANSISTSIAVATLKDYEQKARTASKPQHIGRLLFAIATIAAMMGTAGILLGRTSEVMSPFYVRRITGKAEVAAVLKEIGKTAMGSASLPANEQAGDYRSAVCPCSFQSPDQSAAVPFVGSIATFWWYNPASKTREEIINEGACNLTLACSNLLLEFRQSQNSNFYYMCGDLLTGMTCNLTESNYTMSTVAWAQRPVLPRLDARTLLTPAALNTTIGYAIQEYANLVYNKYFLGFSDRFRDGGQFSALQQFCFSWRWLGYNLQQSVSNKNQDVTDEFLVNKQWIDRKVTVQTDWFHYADNICAPTYCDVVSKRSILTRGLSLFALLGGGISAVLTSATVILWPGLRWLLSLWREKTQCQQANHVKRPDYEGFELQHV